MPVHAVLMNGDSSRFLANGSDLRSDFRGLILALSRARVESILIGGVAAAIHGAARATFDLDVEAIAELEALADRRQERR